MPAPLYQQVFRWFRKKHKLSHDVDEYADGDYTAGIYKNHFVVWETDNHVTYEEAEMACIRELITIVKNEKTEIN